jgi:hypothetical protein
LATAGRVESHGFTLCRRGGGRRHQREGEPREERFFSSARASPMRERPVPWARECSLISSPLIAGGRIETARVLGIPQRGEDGVTESRKLLRFRCRMAPLNYCAMHQYSHFFAADSSSAQYLCSQTSC